MDQQQQKTFSEVAIQVNRSIDLISQMDYKPGRDLLKLVDSYCYDNRGRALYHLKEAAFGPGELKPQLWFVYSYLSHIRARVNNYPDDTKGTTTNMIWSKGFMTSWLDYSTSTPEEREVLILLLFSRRLSTAVINKGMALQQIALVEEYFNYLIESSVPFVKDPEKLIAMGLTGDTEKDNKLLAEASVLDLYQGFSWVHNKRGFKFWAKALLDMDDFSARLTFFNDVKDLDPKLRIGLVAAKVEKKPAQKVFFGQKPHAAIMDELIAQAQGGLQPQPQPYHYEDPVEAAPAYEAPHWFQPLPDVELEETDDLD